MSAPTVPSQAPGRVVIELECGVTVYLASGPGDRWRAVWYEDGRRRQYQGVTEDRLAARLEPVTQRLATGAQNMERPGADLIAHYLSPDRHPADSQWSRRHTDTQYRLCVRYAARSSTRSAARTSRPGTCSRSSTPRPPQGKASESRE